LSKTLLGELFMPVKLLTVAEVCASLRWGETKLYERRAAGLFPRPVNVSGSKKGNLYFQHEIELYILRAIHISTDDEFRALAQEIELNRNNLAA
jgi:predicted DNA-binding transcriptional regulator AlpA